ARSASMITAAISPGSASCPFIQYPCTTFAPPGVAACLAVFCLINGRSGTYVNQCLNGLRGYGGVILRPVLESTVLLVRRLRSRYLLRVGPGGASAGGGGGGSAG